jgi:hypothetical protein
MNALKRLAGGATLPRLLQGHKVPLHVVVPARAEASGLRALSTSSDVSVKPTEESEKVTISVYKAKNPTMWMVAGRLFAFKKWLGLSGAVATAIEATQQAGASWDEIMDTLMGVGESAAAEAALSSMSMPVYFLLVGAFGHVASRAIVNRTVVGIDVILPKGDAHKMRPIEKRKEEIESSPDPYSADLAAREEIAGAVHPDACKHHTVVIHRPKLWNNKETEKHHVPRDEVLCCPPNKTETCFDLRLPSGRRQQQYLWPFPGSWTSGNRAYLVALLYQDYFLLKERAPPPDTRLIRGIEGFGPYRPAQFADPYHPAAQQLAADAAASPDGRLPSRDRIEGTPFWIEKNTVWSEFNIPPRPSLEKRREAERQLAIAGGNAQTPGRTAADLVMQDTLPSLPAPLTLMLDGSHMYVDVEESVSPQAVLAAAGVSSEEELQAKAVPVASAVEPRPKELMITDGAREASVDGGEQPAYIERFERWGNTVVKVTVRDTTAGKGKGKGNGGNGEK